MAKFGLIGKTLKHSYSKIIHEKFGKYPYELYELEKADLNNFLRSDITGFNVTIPYKKDIMEFLDVIDDSAKKIGAVNTVIKRDGLSYGYNTDFKGMQYMLSRADISLKDKVVMILGTGGTAFTATAVALDAGAKKIISVSRTGEINYQNYFEQKDVQILINTTPVGMYPNVGVSPVELDAFSELEGVVDVIYNPAITELLFKAKDLGVKHTNGLSMLVAQAKFAMEIFLSQTFSNDIIERVISEIEKETFNVVLIGMPGSGKSTIASKIAKALNKELIDTDAKIVKMDGRSIPQIFDKDGEEYFRNLENQVATIVGKESSKIIATGGGIVKNKENYKALKQNGVIFYVDRAVEKLSQDGRPLSKDLETVKKLYSERKDLYMQFSDCVVDNNGDIEKTVKGIIDKL